MTINESIILSEFFYSSSFTDITLLQIFIFLAVPYMILYWFKEFTEFDNFTEKWEGALFIFFFGFFSYILTFFIYQYASKFILSYFLSLFLISFFLYISWKLHYSKKNIERYNTGTIIMKNKKRYFGNFSEIDNYIIFKGKITTLENKKQIVLDCKKLVLKIEDIDRIQQ